MAGLMVEIKPPQRAPGLEASFCHGQAMSLHRHVMNGDFFLKANIVKKSLTTQEMTCFLGNSVQYDLESLEEPPDYILIQFD